MHKFKLYPCRIEKNSDKPEFVASLGSISNEKIMLFFPVPESIANLINYIQNTKDKAKLNNSQDAIGVYKTMIDSWKSGDRYLSGIVIDSKYMEDLDDDIIEASMILIDDNGNLDSFTKTSFVHAMVVASLEDVLVTMTDSLLDRIYYDKESLELTEESIPNDSLSGDEDFVYTQYPMDSHIIRIAQKIIEEKDEKDEKENESGENT